MAQFTLNNTNPLSAGGTYVSPWLLADPLYPFVTVQASSDQAGTLVLYESDQNDGTGAQISAHQVGSVSVPASGTVGTLSTANSMIQVQIHALYYRVVYTNGTVAQLAFNLNLYSGTIAVDSTQNRKFDLLLRELRVQTHLLLWLKDPAGVPPNLPMGFDLVQGDTIPAGLQATPLPATNPPSFS